VAAGRVSQCIGKCPGPWHRSATATQRTVVNAVTQLIDRDPPIMQIEQSFCGNHACLASVSIAIAGQGQVWQ
jgi:hypothetical protein